MSVPILSQVKEFLEKVNAKIPQVAPAHHCLMAENGAVMLWLFLGEWVLPIRFDEIDLSKSVDELLDDVVRLHAEFIARGER